MKNLFFGIFAIILIVNITGCKKQKKDPYPFDNLINQVKLANDDLICSYQHDTNNIKDYIEVFFFFQNKIDSLKWTLYHEDKTKTEHAGIYIEIFSIVGLLKQKYDINKNLYTIEDYRNLPKEALHKANYADELFFKIDRIINQQSN